MAKSASRFSTVYNRGKFLLRCNPKRAMGKDPCSVGGTSADRRGAKARSQLRNHRLAKRKNNLSRGTTRNRWWKKTKGRKRHIVTDTMGNLLAVVVHAANIHDTKSGILAARDAVKNIHPFKDSVRMRDIARHLSRMFLKSLAFVLILLHAHNLDGRSCLSGGSWSAPWLG